jgi:hypothetical protein
MKLHQIDIVSLCGNVIAHTSGNGKDAVSIDTRSISGVKTGFYCAKVKSLTGLSTTMISIGVDNSKFSRQNVLIRYS